MPPDYLRLICSGCANKLNIKGPWRDAMLCSSEGLCQWCWEDVSVVGDLAEVDLRVWETANILNRSW